MTFNKKLLDIVACPACKGKLVLHEVPHETADGDAEKAAKQVLVCRFDRLEYPIDEGIPVLLESEARVLSLEELEQVKQHD
ncbi:Trm112 family protein [Glaciecola sp. SC05]|uniref:Trm112 family protein n=1 Tax=Glaciecola sp. SC05 TaxID=1987355 RepID=UPI003528F439